MGKNLALKFLRKNFINKTIILSLIIHLIFKSISSKFKEEAVSFCITFLVFFRYVKTP